MQDTTDNIYRAIDLALFRGELGTFFEDFEKGSGIYAIDAGCGKQTSETALSYCYDYYLDTHDDRLIYSLEKLLGAWISFGYDNRSAIKACSLLEIISRSQTDASAPFNIDVDYYKKLLYERISSNKDLYRSDMDIYAYILEDTSFKNNTVLSVS